MADGVAPSRDRDAVLQAVADWLRTSEECSEQDLQTMVVAEADLGLVAVVTVGQRDYFTSEVHRYVGKLAVQPRATRAGVGTALMGCGGGTVGSSPRLPAAHAGNRRWQPRRAQLLRSSGLPQGRRPAEQSAVTSAVATSAAEECVR